MNRFKITVKLFEFFLSQPKMLNYDNITIGLEVEFVVDDQLCEGFVRYKGPVNGKEGVWIGIEAKSQGTFRKFRMHFKYKL